MPRLAAILTLALSTVLAGCSQQDSLDRIRDSGQLRVMSRNSPTTWYTDKQGATGFEYELASAFADHLGVKLVILPAFNYAEVFEKLDRGEADLAAAGLVRSDGAKSRFPQSTAYSKIQPQVIYVGGTFRPRSIEDLDSMSIVTLAGSIHSRYLKELRREQLPDLRWREVTAADPLELLDLLNKGKAQLAVVNANEFAVQRSLYPRLRVAFDLGPARDLAWYLSPEGDQRRLLQEVDNFLQKMQDDGSLQALREKHFRGMQIEPRIGANTFTRRMRQLLPRYRDAIRQVAAEYQMDWQLLAAMAYQESHWDPLAQSPTGVRGMMMLTVPTADEMGVSDRLDPIQSLRGGARYLKNIQRRLPRDIGEPDRTFMALAAYNVGRAHLEDARVLTERQGGNPHLWSDVRERLPLLQNSKYFSTLKHGYARGQEAAVYVENIRYYRSILEWEDISTNKPLPPVRVQDYLPPVLQGTELRAL